MKEVCTYIYDESKTKREGNIGLHNVLIYTYTRQTIITIVVCTQPKSYQNISFIEYSRGKEKEGWYGIIVSAIQGVCSEWCGNMDVATLSLLIHIG